jgi:hypothetical protein
MANLCLNRIEFFGSAQAIAKIKNDMTSPSFGEGEGFYSMSYVTSSEDELRIDIESRWSPPVFWLESLSKQYGVLVECEYEEIGSDIWGKFGFKKGESVFNIELPYLEGKYNSMDWNDFLECEAFGRADNADTLEEFISEFDFCSQEEISELRDIYEEVLNEN